MLTHLRYFGYIFNPVTFYYCYDKEGKSVETIVAEITNTPWKERHCYVLCSSSNPKNLNKHRFELDKEFHISPFIDMDHRYIWSFTNPNDSLSVHMENYSEAEKHFDATLTLRQKPLTKSTLMKAIMTYPFMTIKVITTIHWQALKLWLKDAPFFEHPQYRKENTQENVL